MALSSCAATPCMERAAELRAATRLQTADAIHLAAALHWGCDALLTNDRAFHLSQAPIEVLRLVPDQPSTPPS